MEVSQKLDYTDLRIIEGVASYGPRNISQVARTLGMPIEMVRRRIKRMRSRKLLWLHADIYHTNLGLKKAVVIAEATPGYEKLLSNCLKANDFWIYITRCYGRFEGYLGIYTIPKNHCNDFEGFLAKLKEVGVVQNTHIFWSTCFQNVNPTTNWFDPYSQEWVFPWETWIEEIQTREANLPSTLQDPEDFPIKGDYVDIFILKEMEKDATINFSDIAMMLGLTLQDVRYHYHEHVVKRRLLEGFEVEVFPYDETASDIYFLVFRFPDMKKMAKFALSLLDKPFVFFLGKILGQPGMVGQLYLPRKEFKNFKDSLSTLIRRGFLQSYDYMIQHSDEWSRQTIPYEFFENETWIYNHEKHIRTLKELVENYRF
ncbi:MAG: AsnC family protein [Candidatus Bathyarchaeia archaeon]